jgi:hypothetical protein
MLEASVWMWCYRIGTTKIQDSPVLCSGLMVQNAARKSRPSYFIHLGLQDIHAHCGFLAI